MSATRVHRRRRFRALFVSDLHLGYKGADIAALNALLASCEIDHLYLVGDILDGWKLEKRWHWTQDYCDFIDTLMALRRRRVRITLLTGNHDEKLRDIVPTLLRPFVLRRFGIRIDERCVHRTLTGAQLLVTHGDQFDGMLWRGSSKVADRIWDLLTEAGFARAPRPGPRWSLGRAIARGGGGLADRYAATALRKVLRESADGIVFGHSHVPLLERRGESWLANCGSWTRAADGAHTAVAETCDGQLELVRWPASAPRIGVHLTAALHVREPDSAYLIRHIHALWRPMEPTVELPPRPATARPTLPQARPA